jgi:hypothetical protein
VPYSLYKGALYLYLSQSRCPQRCVFSGFHRGGNEICALLRFYASYIASMLPTFRDNLSVQSSRANISKEITVSVDWTDLWRWGPTGWPETSARNYRSVLRKISIERISHSRPQRFIYARWKCQVKQHKTQHNTKHNTKHNTTQHKTQHNTIPGLHVTIKPIKNLVLNFWIFGLWRLKWIEWNDMWVRALFRSRCIPGPKTGPLCPACEDYRYFCILAKRKFVTEVN